MSVEFLVYLGGVIVMSWFWAPLKTVLGGGAWFVGGVVVCLLAIRLIGYAVSRISSSSRNRSD